MIEDYRQRTRIAVLPSFLHRGDTARDGAARWDQLDSISGVNRIDGSGRERVADSGGSRIEGVVHPHMKGAVSADRVVLDARLFLLCEDCGATNKTNNQQHMNYQTDFSTHRYP